ncbi:MAG: molecular chaperone DnaK [bacterium]
MGRIIGIDLGTTNSAMAYMSATGPQVIPNREGANTTPSVIALVADGSRAVGASAKNQSVLNPTNTFFSIKRFIGRTFTDPDVQRDIKLVPYEVRKSKTDGIEVKFGEEWMAPEAISAMVLAKLKADAEAYLGEKVDKAVITVPAYFDDSQRQATKNAGKIAGLEVERIINEPTAASLAYGLDKKKNEIIAVYDLGGGTFDITILDIGDGIFEVLATNGDTHLGGDDFDQVIINYLADEFKKTNSIDLREDTSALQRLKEAGEKAKIELSSVSQTVINLPYITADTSGPKHLNINMTRAKLEELVEPLIKETLEPVKKALKDSGKSSSEINEIVMVGGMTRMPKVIQVVKDFFGKEPNLSVNPDEVVAVGAAIQGGVITGDVHDITLLDVIPLSIGLETEGKILTKMIERNTTIPVSKSQVFTTAANNQPAVDIRIAQGERPMFEDNKILGTFTLEGIDSAPRGVPQIEVTFDIDANGILKVTAKDKKNNKTKDITIHASSNLSDEEVDKLIKDAEMHATEDKTKKDLAEAKNDLEQQINESRKIIDEHVTLLSEEDKKSLSDKREEAEKVLADSVALLDDIRAKSQEMKDKNLEMLQKANDAKKPEEAPEQQEAKEPDTAE